MEDTVQMAAITVCSRWLQVQAEQALKARQREELRLWLEALQQSSKAEELVRTGYNTEGSRLLGMPMSVYDILQGCRRALQRMHRCTRPCAGMQNMSVVLLHCTAALCAGPAGDGRDGGAVPSGAVGQARRAAAAPAGRTRLPGRGG